MHNQNIYNLFEIFVAKMIVLKKFLTRKMVVHKKRINPKQSKFIVSHDKR